VPANTTPIFPYKPIYKQVTVNTINNDRSGATTANLYTLITGSTEGTKITQIGVKFQGQCVSGSILVFIESNSTLALFDEIPVSAASASDGVPSYRSVNLYNDFQIPTGSLVKVGMTAMYGPTGSTVYCMAGDY
jgi:hypothetical protein